MLETALGMIETKGLVAAIEAADAALKAAKVKLVSKEKVTGAIINIKIVGDVAAVRAAIDAGAEAARKVGEVLSTHVIPNPISDLEYLIYDLPGSKILEESPVAEPEEKGSEDLEPETEITESDDDSEIEPTQLSIDYSVLNSDDTEYLNELQKLSVHELRKIAREIEGLSIHGRQISMANKTRLLEELIKVRLEKK